jgi:hypothetical protein
VAVALVPKFIHLFAHNIGVLAYPTKYLNMLKEWRLNQAEAKDPGSPRKARYNIRPSP